MKYTRKEIDKTGKVLLTAVDPEKYKQAIEKLNDWRSLHLVPLDKLQQKIVDFLDFNNIRAFLISRRLKRLTSIQYKLDLNPDMRLGGMQDIGGSTADNGFTFQKNWALKVSSHFRPSCVR